MTEFIAVLNLYRTAIMGFMDIAIPLGEGLSIRYGTLIIGVVFTPVLFNILFRLFSDGGVTNSEKRPSKEQNK